MNLLSEGTSLKKLMRLQLESLIFHSVMSRETFRGWSKIPMQLNKEQLFLKLDLPCKKMDSDSSFIHSSTFILFSSINILTINQYIVNKYSYFPVADSSVMSSCD